MNSNWPSAIVALGFIGFVGFALWLASENDFDQIWSGVSTIVGVVVGAIPSFFFKSQADKAQSVAAEATQNAERTSRRAEVLAGAVEPSRVEVLKEEHRDLFTSSG